MQRQTISRAFNSHQTLQSDWSRTLWRHLPNAVKNVVSAYAAAVFLCDFRSVDSSTRVTKCAVKLARGSELETMRRPIQADRLYV